MNQLYSPYQQYPPYQSYPSYPQYQPISKCIGKSTNSFLFIGVLLLLIGIVLVVYGSKLILDNDENNYANSQNYTNNNYDPKINRFYTNNEILLMTPTQAIVTDDPKISIITVNNRIVKTYIHRVGYNARLSMTNNITQDLYSDITINKPMNKGEKLTVYYQIGGRLTPPFLTSDYVTYPELNIYDDTNKKIGIAVIVLAVLTIICGIYLMTI